MIGHGGPVVDRVKDQMWGHAMDLVRYRAGVHAINHIWDRLRDPLSGLLMDNVAQSVWTCVRRR